jgi:hypothetical protein
MLIFACMLLHLATHDPMDDRRRRDVCERGLLVNRSPSTSYISAGMSLFFYKSGVVTSYFGGNQWDFEFGLMTVLNLSPQARNFEDNIYGQSLWIAILTLTEVQQIIVFGLLLQ